MIMNLQFIVGHKSFENCFKVNCTWLVTLDYLSKEIKESITG